MMEDKPLVSIIVNCYNGAAFVNNAIQAVLFQTYQNWELIFWDNCSTDDSAKKIALFKDARIKYFHSEVNTSLGEARNLAISKAKGVYFSFLDIDDTWEPAFLERMIAVFALDAGLGLAYCRYNCVVKDKNRSYLSQGSSENHEVAVSELLKMYNIGISAVMVKKEVIELNHIHFCKEFSLIEDYDFFIRIASFSTVFYLAEPLANYLIHDTNLSKSSKWAEEFRILMKKISDGDVTYEYLQQYVVFIDHLSQRYEVTCMLKEGRRCNALRFVMKHAWRNPILFSYLVHILLGEQITNTIRAVIHN